MRTVATAMSQRARSDTLICLGTGACGGGVETRAADGRKHRVGLVVHAVAVHTPEGRISYFQHVAGKTAPYRPLAATR